MAWHVSKVMKVYERVQVPVPPVVHLEVLSVQSQIVIQIRSLPLVDLPSWLTNQPAL